MIYSGKTTFLSALLNKVPLSSGRIVVNHQHSMADVLDMNVVGFVPQADVMMDVCTVRDIIEHAAFMRLPASMPRHAKKARAAAVMDLLGISHIADSVVGNDLERGISGGQRKRVSIAMELVADPLLLMLDGTAKPTHSKRNSTTRHANIPNRRARRQPYSRCKSHAACSTRLIRRSPVCPFSHTLFSSPWFFFARADVWFGQRRCSAGV